MKVLHKNMFSNVCIHSIFHTISVKSPELKLVPNLNDVTLEIPEYVKATIFQHCNTISDSLFSYNIVQELIKSIELNKGS